MISEYRLAHRLLHERHRLKKQNTGNVFIDGMVRGYSEAIDMIYEIASNENLRVQKYQGNLKLSHMVKTMKNAVKWIDEHKFATAKRILLDNVKRSEGKL
jgi:hypothetical protein